MENKTYNLSLNRPLDSAQWRNGLRGKFEPIFNYIQSLRSIRTGSPLSRFFRHIFEHKHVKRVLGTNLAAFALISALAPVSSSIPFDITEDTIIQAPEPEIRTEIAVRRPTENTQINQGYSFFHPGIDYEGITGEPIYPIMDGHVEYLQYSNYDYGNAVLVDHENGYQSLYAHMSKIYVSEGDIVNTLEAIGEVGSTGRSSGDHLHIEVYEDSRNVNPLNIIP